MKPIKGKIEKLLAGFSAHESVERGKMNVQVLGARVVGVELVKDLVWGFPAAEFTNEKRQSSQLKKVRALANNCSTKK